MQEEIQNLRKELDQQSNAVRVGSGNGKRFSISNKSSHTIILPSINNAQTSETNEPKQQQFKAHLVYQPEKNDNLIESSIMFTRLDAERNTKRLRRAITRGFLTDQVFEV